MVKGLDDSLLSSNYSKGVMHVKHLVKFHSVRHLVYYLLYNVETYIFRDQMFCGFFSFLKEHISVDI